MSLFDALISIIVPYDCFGCGAEGRLLCVACVGTLKPAPACCYRCRESSPGFLTCLSCRPDSPLSQVQAVTSYQQLAKNLVWKLKFGHAQAAAREIATLMSPLVSDAARGSLVILPVPTATTRIRQRGYDQARLLARALARNTRMPYVDALARQSQTHQVGASGQERRQQLAGAFRVTRPRLVDGLDILLVDDVVTTGATLEAAALALRAAGARHIQAVVFAQPKLRHKQTVNNIAISRVADLKSQPAL